jgi:hypothetical protein
MIFPRNNDNGPPGPYSPPMLDTTMLVLRFGGVITPIYQYDWFLFFFHDELKHSVLIFGGLGDRRRFVTFVNVIVGLNERRDVKNWPTGLSRSFASFLPLDLRCLALLEASSNGRGRSKTCAPRALNFFEIRTPKTLFSMVSLTRRTRFRPLWVGYLIARESAKSETFRTKELRG